jgi:hypothetical protein
VLFAPGLFWSGGVLEEETIVFLENYLDERTLAQKVFDPHGNDFDTYQARELSYFFDFLDAQWLRAQLQRGIVLFIPPSALFASALTVAVFRRGAGRAFPALGPAPPALVLLLLLSNYVFLTTMGLFYRATKPLLVPALLALLFLVCERLRPAPGAHPRPRRDLLAAFGLGVLACGLDRQGFFYLALIAVFLAVHWAVRRTGGPLALGAVAAALWGLAYNHVFGPWLVHAVNGYWPRFQYQRMPLRKLLDPSFYGMAAELLPQYAATLFGGFPVGVFVSTAVLALAVFLLRLRATAGGPREGPPSRAWVAGVLLAALFLASQVFMFAAMIMRYPQVYDWADHRLWYYPWPFQAILAFGALAGLDAVHRRLGPRALGAAQIGLVALIVANVAHWPRHREVSLHSDWFPKIHDQTARLRASLAGGAADAGLHGAYREFLHFAWDLSPALAGRIGAHVREGAGVHRTELRQGRLFAWARQGAAVHLLVAEAGPYVLRGGLWLRPGETVAVSRAGAVVARLSGPEAGEGELPFALPLELPRGRVTLELASDTAERDVGGRRDRKAAAFGLFLPVLERAARRPDQNSLEIPVDTPTPGPSWASLTFR